MNIYQNLIKYTMVMLIGKHDSIDTILNRVVNIDCYVNSGRLQ